MIVTLKKPNIAHYSNAYHIEFHKTSYPICFKYGTIINAPDLISNYQTKVTQEDNVYKWMRKSDYTEKKAETDHARDQVYSGIFDIVQVNLKHFDPLIRDNASHLYNLLSNYGDLINAGYDAETADIDSLLTRLGSPEYLPAVQNLGLVSWVTELANQNALFKSYVDDTAQEQVEKPNITPLAARRETDEALRRITARVTALIDLNGPDMYVPFVEEFNVLVNHYNTLLREHYGRLHAKTDISAAMIAPVDVQPYTGKPVYVIPTVSIVKKAKDGSETEVELVFSEDYTVGYKNNVEPGTAMLIITGTGKYTGEIVTTFNISKKL
jgi:hypothetical protein